MCNISQTKQATLICRKAKVPLFLWGPPGVGKTESQRQLAEELNINFRSITAPLINPADILGIPDRNGSKMIWLRPEMLPDSGEGIMLLDEVPDATPIMQKAFYSLVLEHRIMSHVIPEEWYIVGAGNRAEDKSLSSTLPSPLITRFVHIGVCCSCPDFKESTVESASIDVDDFIKYSLVNFHPLISAYLKFRPECIYKHQAVPRTWEYVSKLLTSTPDYNINKDREFVFGQLIQGTVGVEIGREFIKFLNLTHKVPNINRIISDPMNSPIPIEKDIQYAVVAALLKLIKEDNDTNIIKYIKRLESEMQFLFFNMAKRDKAFICSNPEYINWANSNREVLI